ncbi:MAG: hydroxymethylbilane synthase [Planctomycetota bacterium]|jgi:hydroxymethylbilane synthase
MRLVLGTRGSLLARTQSGWVADKLRACGHAVELKIISTRGDREQDRPVAELGGKGLFTAELEEALRDGSIHLAVHSLKDLPVEDPEGLCLAAVPAREAWQDVLVSKDGLTLEQLPQGARVGTASRRRRALLLAQRPDLSIHPLRGNVDTRVSKALDGDLDAVVLAAAGLRRMGREGVPHSLLDMLPAPAQGALGVQAAAAAGPVHEALHVLHDERTALAVAAERSLLSELGGGCSTPVGALAVLRESSIHLRAVVATTDGKRVLTSDGQSEDPVGLGIEVASRLFEQGAKEILDAEG